MEAPDGAEAPRRVCSSEGGCSSSSSSPRSPLSLRPGARRQMDSRPSGGRGSRPLLALPASLSSSVKSSSTSAATRSSSGSTRNARANGGESRKPPRAGRWG